MPAKPGSAMPGKKSLKKSAKEIPGRRKPKKGFRAVGKRRTTC